MSSKYSAPLHTYIKFTTEVSWEAAPGEHESIKISPSKLRDSEKKYIRLFKWYKLHAVKIRGICHTFNARQGPHQIHAPSIKTCFNSEPGTHYGLEIIRNKQTSHTHPPLTDFVRFMKVSPKYGVLTSAEKHTLIASRDEFIDASELDVQYGSFEMASYLSGTPHFFKPVYTVYVTYYMQCYGQDLSMLNF